MLKELGGVMQMDANIVVQTHIMVNGGINMGKNIHVVPHDGEWQVKAEGDSQPITTTKTQKEATGIARKISQDQHSELIIHGADGRIREKDSHGNDPYPPRG